MMNYPMQQNHPYRSTKKRTSTQYSMIVGTSLVIVGLIVSIFAIYTKAVTGEAIVNLVWAQYISAAAFFGVNLTRVAAENMSGVGNYGGMGTGMNGSYGGMGMGGMGSYGMGGMGSSYGMGGGYGGYGSVGGGYGQTGMYGTNTTIATTAVSVTQPPVGFPHDGNEEGPPIPEGQPTHPNGAPIGTLDFKPPGE